MGRKKFRESVVQPLVAGLVVVAPVYLALLLLLKAMKSLDRLAKPLTHFLPRWFPGETVVTLLLVLLFCFLVGLSLHTAIGRAIEGILENSLLRKIPGYNVFRGMTQQLAGQSLDSSWKPALVEIEEALVPAFIVEGIDDGRFTVFVPSVPTLLAGTVYILTPERVHPVDVPFTRAVKCVTQWGSGSKELVNAMQGERTPLLVKRQ
jgi:uncharacterized membrane protein